MAFRSVFAAAIGLLLSGCAGVQIPGSGSEGAQVFTARCGTCHATPHPARHSMTEWLQLLPLMDRRMSERGMPALDDEDRQIIIAYLKKYAR